MVVASDVGVESFVVVESVVVEGSVMVVAAEVIAFIAPRPQSGPQTPFGQTQMAP